MASHDHSHNHGGVNSCGHSDGSAAGPGNGEEEDFNEFLEDTHPCCQKDAESKARALKLRAALDKVDPSQIAERARKAAFSSGVTGLPVRGGGGAEDYPALRDARATAAAKGGGTVGTGLVVSGEGAQDGANRSDGSDDDDDDDDDDDLDYLLDDPEITHMAQARVEAMHADAARLQSLRALGFGVHSEVPESEVEVASSRRFRGAGVVLHLYNPDSTLGAWLDLLLECKAGSYMGTRFMRCRLNPESGVASRMRIQRVPALACYKGGVRVAYTEQLSQFGDSDGVEPGAVDRWLAASGTLEFDPPDINTLREGNGVLGARGGRDESEEDEAAEARFDCGLDGCHKTFRHDHFLAAAGGRGLPEGFGEGV
ncbi:unnamed protein product [Pylaiella littoralis]